VVPAAARHAVGAYTPGMTDIRLPALPFPLAWTVPPAASEPSDGRLVVAAGERTDLFTSPAGDPPNRNAPRLLGTPPDAAYRLSATVRVDFAHTFDAGVLVLYGDERCWAKLCFEYSPQGRGTVVSVVTADGVSDDANAFEVDGPEVRLRVSRLGPDYAFHAAVAGGPWVFVRHFALGTADPVPVGLLAQSPTGPGCRVTFSDLSYVPGGPADLRDGS
jgi:regulation of enolase protein 1 (concanavalin A-like superfamily)